MKQRFFGHPESPLFGVYHKPRAVSGRAASRAVVICPPIGQEYNRTHWSLRLLANQLTRRNIHVLRLDYHGVGDSSRSIDEIDSLNIWRRDIGQAIQHLKQQSKAETVMLIGQRWGGTLAAMVAKERVDVNSVVLWEPVVEGQAYLSELRSMHAQMLDLWVSKMQTENSDRFEEILGSKYQRQLLNEIANCTLAIDSVIQPQLIVDAKHLSGTYSHPEPGNQKFLPTSRPESWGDLRELETAYLRPKLTHEMVALVDEMFQRLEQHNALRVALEEPADLFEMESNG